MKAPCKWSETEARKEPQTENEARHGKETFYVSEAEIRSRTTSLKRGNLPG